MANWKLNPQGEAQAIKLARSADKKGVVVCPPFPFLRAVGRTIKRAALGAQDTFWEEKGAYTGEVSPTMLKGMGVKYVIVGHSERRQWLGENDQMINKKVLAAQRAGLKVVLCVGEPLKARRKGLKAAMKFVERQLEEDLRKVKANSIIIAYEPIWAIGTGRPDNPKESAQMAEFIKLFVSEYGCEAKVLYGGSVTAKNIGRIMEYNVIDGVLVGGASLKSGEFGKIIRKATHAGR